MLKNIWNTLILPLLDRPSRFQVAALCYRRNQGAFEVLLITSRETKRWVLPKGWPKRGFDAAGTALEEAWEEAGVIARNGDRRKVGNYHYDKRMKGGVPSDTIVDVYAVAVDRLEKDFPEADERQRKWMSLAEAADAVNEPELKTLLRALRPEDLK